MSFGKKQEKHENRDISGQLEYGIWGTLCGNGLQDKR